jgi:hypothetical protein
MKSYAYTAQAGQKTNLNTPEHGQQGKKMLMSLTQTYVYCNKGVDRAPVHRYDIGENGCLQSEGHNWKQIEHVRMHE